MSNGISPRARGSGLRAVTDRSLEPTPQPPTITHAQYLQLRDLFALAERHVRQLAEIRAVVVVRLGAVSAEPDLPDLVSDAIFGSTGVDDLLAELGITVAPPADA